MSKVSVTPGSGADIATNDITRDGSTEKMQLINVSDPATGLSANVASTGLIVDNSANTQPVILKGSSSAAQTNVAASVTAVTIIIANAARRHITVRNDSAVATLALSLSGTASPTNLVEELAPGATWTPPIPWLGSISGIWDQADAAGAARVTEYL